MTNGVSPVLGVIAREVLQLEGGIARLGKAFESLNRTSMVMGGGVAFLGGAAALTAMSKMVEHGEKLVHVKQQLLAADVKGVELAEATAKAWELSRKYGMDVSHVLSDIKEARMVFGSTQHAIDFMGPLEQMRVVLNSVKDGSGNSAKDSVYDMARAGELKGLQKPEDFVRYFDGMTKAITASGGKVDPKGFFQATQYGRLASQGWDEEFYTKYLPSMIQEMRPSGAGTALMSLFGTGVQGKASIRAVKAMKAFGLIGDESRVIHNKLGDTVGMKSGALIGSDMLTHNPFKWAQEVLGPLLKAKFGNDVTAQNPGVIGALGDMFGNRMSAQAIATLALQGKRIGKDAGLIGQAHGLDFADQLLKNDPTAAMNKFKTAWDNMLTAFTEPLVQPKIDMMNRLADAMNNFAKWAVENPGTVAVIEKGLIGLAAGITALGAAAVIAALASLGGPAGLIIGLATALGTLGAFVWKDLIGWIKGFGDALSWLWQKISTLGGLFSKTSFGGDGFGAGGMFQRASWGGAGGGDAGVGWAKDVPGGSAAVNSYIRQSAIAHGIDPNVAMAVARSEGLGSYVGDGGTSFGPYQLHVGGGLGDGFKGNLRDHSTWKSQVDYALGHAAKGGWGPWHGAARVGIGRWQGIHGGSHVAPYRKQEKSPVIENVMYIDGETIHRSTTRRMVAKATHPTQAPYHDGASAWTPPDAGLVAV